jgi:hypothetical protein
LETYRQFLDLRSLVKRLEIQKDDEILIVDNEAVAKFVF